MIEDQDIFIDFMEFLLRNTESINAVLGFKHSNQFIAIFLQIIKNIMFSEFNSVKYKSQ